MEDADVELTAFHSGELMSNEDFLELRQSTVAFQDAETGGEIMVSPSSVKTLGIKRLVLILQKADELANMTEDEENHNVERSSKVSRGTKKALACYKAVHEEKKAAVQLKFFTKQPTRY
jgi:hypothetical protein